MESVQVKVIIDEINKLRAEVIDMKMELEMLKADIRAINEMNKKEVALRVVGQGESAEGHAIIEVIENKEKIKKQNDFKVKKIDIKEKKHESEFRNINRNLKNAFSKKLKKVVNSEIRYDTWLKMGVENLTGRDGIYRFLAPNDFTKGIIESRYKEIVEKALKEVFKEIKGLEIIVQEQA